MTCLLITQMIHLLIACLESMGGSNAPQCHPPGIYLAPRPTCPTAHQNCLLSRSPASVSKEIRLSVSPLKPAPSPLYFKEKVKQTLQLLPCSVHLSGPQGLSTQLPQQPPSPAFPSHTALALPLFHLAPGATLTSRSDLLTDPFAAQLPRLWSVLHITVSDL